MISQSFFFFFNDTATTEIYTLSLHDALPISLVEVHEVDAGHAAEDPLHLDQPGVARGGQVHLRDVTGDITQRSEEHTSELQSRSDLVCRLLLEKKKNTTVHHPTS